MAINPNTLPSPMPKDANYVAPAREPNRPGPQIIAEVTPLEGQLKEGHVQGFTVRCDEGVRPDGTGGTDSAPSPLGYFMLAVGF